MNIKLKKFLVLIASLGFLIAALFALDRLLMESNSTYEDMAEEIDQRDIDMGNALNFNSDETSSTAIYGATQTLAHPPGRKPQQDTE